MQAIRTRFMQPTNNHGARIRALCAAGFNTVDYDHSKDEQANHKAACDALVAKLGWLPARGYKGQWKGGEFAFDWYWVLCTTEERDAPQG